MAKKKSILFTYLTTVTPFSRLLAAILFILFPVIAFSLGINYNKQLSQANLMSDVQTEVKPSQEPVVQPIIRDEEETALQAEILPKVTLKPTASPFSTNENLSGLLSYEGVSYRLPEGWVANVDSWSLMIFPKVGGGYLKLEVYSYPQNIGRREYFCQTSGVCIEDTTRFTETRIGNISGYIADAIDNSGGGREYFGAKGDKFYRISSYNPPSPNEFEKSYQSVLNSFQF